MSLSNPPGARGIYEVQEPIYSLREQKEENKLFEVNQSIRNLLDGLEKNKDKLLVEQKDNED